MSCGDFIPDKPAGCQPQIETNMRWFFDTAIEQMNGNSTKGFSFYLSIGDGMEWINKTYKGFPIVHRKEIEKGKIYFGKIDL